AEGTLTAFRADGRIDYVQDTNGNRVTAVYTGGRLTQLQHSAGPALAIHYNAAGLIDRVTDPAGRQVLYTYDAANQHLVSVQATDGTVTGYTYDTGGNPATANALTSVQ